MTARSGLEVTAHARPAVAQRRARGSSRTRIAVEVALVGWVGSVVGMLVGIAAGVFEWGSVVWILIPIGGLTGLVVGVVAIFLGRTVLPRLQRFSLPVRLLIAIVTLLGGAALATVVGFWIGFLYAIQSMRGVVLVLSVNGLLAVVAGTIVFLYEDLSHRLAQAREELEAERLAQVRAQERAARAELLALQARINPHFFFNALNTAAAFVPEDPGRAERLLERFAGLFRYAFRRGGEPAVPLGEELDFIRSFLEIEQARFGDRLETAIDVDPDVARELVPPLVLQPLVENAVLHGRDAQTGRGRITVRARRGPRGATVVEVIDEGPGPGSASEALPRGHALENIAARVAASRGGRLEIHDAESGGTCARLVFPARATGEAGDEETRP